MAAKKTTTTIDNASLTVGTLIEKHEGTEPRVRIMLPLPPETDSGLKLDPYEHVTINGENPVLIKKGEWVDVTVPVFMQLKESGRYPNL